MINGFNGAYRFLSNFYPVKSINGLITLEHHFQAAKTSDVNVRNAILMAETPSIAKKLGRHVDLRPDWEDIKINYMLDLLRWKFQDPELRQKLLSTRGHENRRELVGRSFLGKS